MYASHLLVCLAVAEVCLVFLLFLFQEADCKNYFFSAKHTSLKLKDSILALAGP